MNGRATEPTVDYPTLARELGLTRRQRENVLESGALNPVQPGRGRRGTQISKEDAERLQRAADIANRAVAAGIIGAGIVLILRLLASGAIDLPS